MTTVHTPEQRRARNRALRVCAAVADDDQPELIRVLREAASEPLGTALLIVALARSTLAGARGGASSLTELAEQVRFTALAEDASTSDDAASAPEEPS